MNLDYLTQGAETRLLSARPQHDTFGIEDAMLIAPGDPGRSILFQRLTRRGAGQMPPLVSATVDGRAVRLFYAWIEGMESSRAFVRDWTVDELSPLLGRVEQNRSFDAGSGAFRDLGCLECHRFLDEGGGIGPDLTGIGKRQSRDELLVSLIEPSRKVAPEYATEVIVTRAGEVVEGRIEREDETRIVLRPAAAFAAPTEITKDEVAGRTVSARSSMPRGILSSLEEDAVLDLLAYLLSDGRRDAAAFR